MIIDMRSQNAWCIALSAFPKRLGRASRSFGCCGKLRILYVEHFAPHSRLLTEDIQRKGDSGNCRNCIAHFSLQDSLLKLKPSINASTYAPMYNNTLVLYQIGNATSRPCRIVRHNVDNAAIVREALCVVLHAGTAAKIPKHHNPNDHRCRIVPRDGRSPSYTVYSCIQYLQ